VAGKQRDQPVPASPRGAVTGDDGVSRCPWGQSPPEYRRYHDQEWGRPVGDEVRTFEKLCLEGFQSGLSWLTILRKRESFRRAFANFDPVVVAGFDEGDVERLLNDASIVRHRGKIEAAVTNARAVLALREEGLLLSGLFWAHEQPPAKAAPARRGQVAPAPQVLSDLPAATAGSQALSAELRRRGFRFVGPTTVYAAMQSLGIVNDHLSGCDFRAIAEAERASFARPAQRPGRA